MAKVTEKTLLEKGKPDGVKSLGDVVTLNLSSMQIKDIDASLFNQLSKLEDLDLSKNRILSFPSGVILPALKKLDLSDNTISQLDFLKNFPNLETVLLAANPLQENDKYLAVYLLPKLTELESINITETRTKITSLETEIAEEIGATWAQHFQDDYEAEENLEASEIDTMYQGFVRIMKKQRIAAKKDEKYSKINDAMLETKATDYFSRFRTDAEIVERKKRRLEKEKEKNGTDSAKNGAVKNGGPRDKKLVNAGLSTCSDYEPVHFLRCHSFNNNPADSKTKIWRCAFQPSFKPSTDSEATSNGANGSGDSRLSDSRLITTCGGDSICLIDCSSGKVMKKYKHAKEDFYCVAWSTLQVMEADGEKRGETTNIIAAAGQQGDIKLLQPDQLLCIALLKGHKKHVNCLLFHTSNPCYLFSGSNDKSVMLWDIGVPVLPDFKTRWKALINFKVPVAGPCDVLNLHLHQEKYIMAATESHLVVWDATAEDSGSRKSVGGKAGGKAAKGPKSRKHLLEIEVPSMNTTHSVVDGLVGVAHSLVATKYVQDGLISLWNLDDAIKNSDGRPVTSVDSITQLKWSSTDQLYINLNASSDGGMLLAGDDTGSIWLYNLSGFAPWGGTASPDSNSLYQPSRIIEWPEIHIKSNDMGDLADPTAKKVIINHLAISDDRLYIIACTDNNIVCIWKQCDE